MRSKGGKSGGSIVAAESGLARTIGLIAVIADAGAEGSIHLHEQFGFEEVGRMGKVGFKFGRWLGTVLLQKSLKKPRRAGKKVAEKN